MCFQALPCPAIQAGADMSKKALSLLISAGFCLFYGLSFGHRLYYLFFISLFLLFLFALLSSLAGLKYCSVSIRANKERLERGETLEITLENRSKFWFFGVVAHFNPELKDIIGEDSLFLEKGRSYSFKKSFRHVGIFSLGIDRIDCSDAFKLFSFSKKGGESSLKLRVLPLEFSLPHIEPKKSDEGRNDDNASSEDVNAPEDLREYRDGDSLKRVHWKISARVGKLHVRRFELPSPKECLLFIKPELCEGLELEERLNARDAILETAFSIAKAQLLKGFSVNVDALKSRKELLLKSPAQLEFLRESLAGLDFEGAVSLKNSMLKAAKRSREIGSIALVARDISGEEIALIEGLKKSGNKLRIYITGEELEERLVKRLILSQIELCYVR